jgi:hypothetical protein
MDEGCWVDPALQLGKPSVPPLRGRPPLSSRRNPTKRSPLQVVRANVGICLAFHFTLDQSKALIFLTWTSASRQSISSRALPSRQE